MNRYAIIGCGCAGFYGLQAIRQLEPNAVIDVFSEHDASPYNPMLTTYYAAGRISREALFPFGTWDALKERYQINVFQNCSVKTVKGDTKTITLSDGTTRSYDKILIATGSRAFLPPIENPFAEKTMTMRTLADAEALKHRLEQGNIQRAVVVGASMTGIKVAELLWQKGIDTVLADAADQLFPLAAYLETAARISQALQAKGLQLLLQAPLRRVAAQGDNMVVHLGEEQAISADLLVVCVGVKVDFSLIDQKQIQTNRGILVDTHMETSASGIYAAGDCAEGWDIQSSQHRIIGLWANAAYQGHTAGCNMAGGQADFPGNILQNISHFCDIDFIGMGDNRIKGQPYIYENKKKGLYIQVVQVQGKPVGVNILGNSRISGVLKNFFLQCLQEPVSPKISHLQRGILYREGLDEDFIQLLEGGAC